MRARELQSIGFSALQVLGILGTVAQTFTAAGTTQATATAITATHSYATTGAENTGAILPAGSDVGDEFTYCNATSTGQNVYPPVGYKLNGKTANQPLYVPANMAARFVCADGNNYMGFF